MTHTTKTPAPPETTLTLLFPPSHRHTSAQSLHHEIHRALRKDKAAKQLRGAVPKLARDLVDTELANLMGRTIATNLTAIVSQGWTTSAALMQAAHRSVDRPGSVEVVTLRVHTIHYDDVIDIDVVVDEVLTVTVTVRFEADLRVTELAASIEGGRVINLRAGKSELTLRLLVQGQVAAQKPIAVDLEAQLELGDGIVLVAAPRPTVPQQHTVVLPAQTTGTLRPQP
jgi:hypothetical protein